VGTKRAPKNGPSDREKPLVNGGPGAVFPQKPGSEKTKKLCEKARFSCETPSFFGRFFAPAASAAQKSAATA